MVEYINLGCGDSYVVSKNWKNFDFYKHSPSILRANILKKLPLPDASCDLVYTSHFFEHIPRADTKRFLDECYRVLKPDGTIRLVLPDLESIVGSYLENRSLGQHQEADFAILELLDQLVRTRRGGEMGDLYRQLSSESGSSGKALREFIFARVGEQLSIQASGESIEYMGFLGRVAKSSGHPVQSVRVTIAGLAIRAWLSALPRAFKKQNVSYADVGEKHHWVWDFYQLGGALTRSGFSNAIKQSPKTSYVRDFPFYPLDVLADGSPKKGLGSMYIEATK